MPGNLFPIGATLANGNPANSGLFHVGALPIAAAQWTYDNNGAFRPIPLADYNAILNVQQAALGAGLTKTIQAVVAGSFFHLLALGISISVAGKAELMSGATAVIDLIIPVNTTYWIPLPAQGIKVNVANNAFIFKNTQGVAVDVIITAIGALMTI